MKPDRDQQLTDIQTMIITANNLNKLPKDH